MGKRKAKRQTIIAQAKYGEDDDLIEWYLSLPSGTRQKEVMRLLRVGLGLPIPEQKSVYSSLSNDDIEALVTRRVTEEMAKQQQEINKTFDEFWDAAKREIHSAVNSMDYQPKSASQYQPIEETVDEATLAERYQNMMKDEW